MKSEQEIYDDVVKRQKEEVVQKSAWDIIDIKYVLGIIAIAGIIAVLWMKDIIDGSVSLVLLICLILAAILIYFRSLADDKDVQGILSEQETKAILKKKLKYKQLFTDELPQGEITIDIISKLRYFVATQTPWKRVVGVRLTARDSGLEMYFAVECNCKTGDIIQIKEVTERGRGFIDEEKDIFIYQEKTPYEGLRQDMRRMPGRYTR